MLQSITNKKWHYGTLDILWNTEYKTLDYYKKPPPLNQIQLWKLDGYTHSAFSGAMFNDQGEIPKWANSIADQLNFKNPGFVFYKMETNDIMPMHSDHFNTYCELFNVEPSDVWRAVIFLEDWKPGHYFDIDNHAVVNYTAGCYVIWNNDVKHSAANIGIEDRYTLQITGTML